MNSTKVSYFLLTLSMILISQSPMLALGDSLFEIICKDDLKETIVCLQLLKTDPQISSATNYFDLSIFIMDFALKKGIEGQNFFINLGKKNPSQAINQCATIYYNSIITAFKGGKRELKEHADIARYETTVAGDGSKNCSSAIEAEKISNPAIDDINDKMSILSDAAFIAVVHYENEKRNNGIGL
ncbi:hypothetical protein TanjilG_24396 [Lupinus angustifolius]|uniref:Pectinesterase inhibitor domain-containing protein n=1 Tax=Lupinus angustifolius TaxID=3871 RepID=A0A1J7GHN0_LUPAN|nr:PREDICTED: uncharacterized protein LOC109341539 [Lupinus angustifolius]OIV89228.1 hypothetical protein TanjilG_24396 [Lupinus angustifolius]